MSKIVINAACRQSCGTDKPFSGLDEQAQAICNELIGKEKRRSAKKTPAATPAPTT
jgi:hypothetical protein